MIERAINCSNLGAGRIDTATLAGRQKIADTFEWLKLIPKPINVTDVAWKVGW